MNAQDLIALGFAVVALAYVVRMIARTLRGKRGCGCGGGEGTCSKSQNATDGRAGIKRVPLVTIGQSRTPSSSHNDETAR